MSDDYHEQISRLRAERHQRETTERINELERDYADYIAQRDAAAESNDLDTFEYADREAERIETEYRQVAPPAPPQPFTETEQDYLRGCSMADLARPHWSGIKSPDGKPLSTWDALVGGSGYATQNLGLDRNSAAYREALEVLGPAEQTGVPTADEFLKTFNETSKHKISAKDYNENVKKLVAAKQRGEYPDR